MLTPEAITRYIKHPYNCPYCANNEIDAIDREFEMDIISQKCKCRNCLEIWVEIYQLTDIEEGFA